MTKSQTDCNRVDELTDETIDYGDIPATDQGFWRHAIKHPWIDSVTKR